MFIRFVRTRKHAIQTKETHRFTIYSQRYTPQFLLMRLRHSVTAQDDASDTLATAFIQHQSLGSSESHSGTATPSGKEIDEFIRDYKEARKVYHKRMIWSDRWTKGQVEWRED